MWRSLLTDEPGDNYSLDNGLNSVNEEREGGEKEGVDLSRPDGLNICLASGEFASAAAFELKTTRLRRRNRIALLFLILSFATIGLHGSRVASEIKERQHQRSTSSAEREKEKKEPSD